MRKFKLIPPTVLALIMMVTPSFSSQAAVSCPQDANTCRIYFYDSSCQNKSCDFANVEDVIQNSCTNSDLQAQLHRFIQDILSNHPNTNCTTQCPQADSNTPNAEEIVQEETTPVPAEQATETPATDDRETANTNSQENASEFEPTPVSAEQSYIEQVVSLVNAERAKVGLSALTIDSNLQIAAATRAKEIETSFAHTRPNGTSFATAITAQGIHYQTAGENIAYGQRTPEEVVLAWMNSEGHRKNILSANYHKIGVGYYQNSRGVAYWSQLFTN